MEQTGAATGAGEQKKRELFRKQKETLDIFLQNGAITRAQYDKSLGDLRVKMGIEEQGESLGNVNT